MLSNGISSGPHQIAQPDLARLEPGFDGDRIQHELQREADAGAGHAAIGQDRALVGGGRIGPAAIGRHPVGARQDARDLRGLEARRERIGRVGAGIDGRLAVDAAQLAVAIGIDGDLVVVLAAIGAGASDARADPRSSARSWPLHSASQDRQTSSGSRIPLWPKPPPTSGETTRIWPCSMPRHIGEAVAHDVRHLRAGVERELVEPVVEGGDDAAAFHRRHALARGRDFAA